MNERHSHEDDELKDRDECQLGYRPTESYLSTSPHLSTYESWLRAYTGKLIHKIWRTEPAEPAAKFIDF